MTQLSTLLLEPACRLIIYDYSFIEVEHQCLSDIAGKRFIKESGSLKGYSRTFIRYEFNESKQRKPRYTSSLCNIFRFQSVNFKIKWRSQSFLFPTMYYTLSCLVTPCHTLSYFTVNVEKKRQFFIGNFKISSQAADFLSHFITPCHSLSHLIAPYPLDWKENSLMLAGSFKISSQDADFLSHLIRPCHSLSLIITQHFMLATLKLVPRLQIFYHILSCLLTPSQTLSLRLGRKKFSFGNFKISYQD